ncbi:MAG: hypothetical protein U1A78_32250 [Polyangia bacterium]
MQLGSILEAGEFHPVGREVTFHILRTSPEGKQDKARVTAVLHFVDEALRHEADRHADEWLRADPLYKKTGIVPLEKRREEEFYAFLIRALRDKDDVTQPFCPLADYYKFRKALVSDVVSYLLRAYKAYVRDEYPETVTEQQAGELVEEALGK